MGIRKSVLYQDLQQRGGATDEHLNEFPGRAVMVRGDAGGYPRGPKALVDKIKKDTVRVVERRLVYACAGLTEALSDGPQVYMSTRHDTTMAAVTLSANLARLIYPLTRKPIAIGIWERFGPVWQQTPVPMRRFLEAAHPRCNWPALVDGFEDPSRSRSSSMQFRHPSWTDCAFVLRRTSAPQSVMLPRDDPFESDVASGEAGASSSSRDRPAGGAEQFGPVEGDCYYSGNPNMCGCLQLAMTAVWMVSGRPKYRQVCGSCCQYLVDEQLASALSDSTASAAASSPPAAAAASSSSTGGAAAASWSSTAAPAPAPPAGPPSGGLCAYSESGYPVCSRVAVAFVRFQGRRHTRKAVCQGCCDWLVEQHMADVSHE